MDKIKTLIVEPLMEPYVIEIDGTLKDLQNIVGGYIEIIYPFEDESISLVVNEEGKLRGLPLNRIIYDDSDEPHKLARDIICGRFAVTAQDEEGNTATLTDEQIAKYAKMYAKAEIFQQFAHCKSYRTEPCRTKVDIYQLDRGSAAFDRSLAFMPYRYLVENDRKVDYAAYKKGYSSRMYDATGGTLSFLDYLFEKFNVDQPLNYSGHSMSISDIIVLTENGITKSYYVDSYGFVELEDNPPKN